MAYFDSVCAGGGGPTQRQPAILFNFRRGIVAPIPHDELARYLAFIHCSSDSFQPPPKAL